MPRGSGRCGLRVAIDNVWGARRKLPLASEDSPEAHQERTQRVEEETRAGLVAVAASAFAIEADGDAGSGTVVMRRLLSGDSSRCSLGSCRSAVLGGAHITGIRLGRAPKRDRERSDAREWLPSEASKYAVVVDDVRELEGVHFEKAQVVLDRVCGLERDSERPTPMVHPVDDEQRSPRSPHGHAIGGVDEEGIALDRREIRSSHSPKAGSPTGTKYAMKPSGP